MGSVPLQCLCEITRLTVLDIFKDRPADFSSLFRRILHMITEDALSITSRTTLLTYIIGAFQALDNGLVRKECAALVSIGIWHNLHSDQAREQRLGSSPQLAKAWRASEKRFDAADEETKVRLQSDRSWLYSLVTSMYDILYDTTKDGAEHSLIYCERMLELLIDLLSQLPTRRYVNALLQDLNLVPVVTLSPMYADEDNSLLRDLLALLNHYINFPTEDHTGKEYSYAQSDVLHHERLAKLQQIALSSHPEKLKLLVLDNFSSLSQRVRLQRHIDVLSDDEMDAMCAALGLRTVYGNSGDLMQDRRSKLELLLAYHERTPTYQQSLRDMVLTPTETSLHETAILRTDDYDATRPLPIPKLNLQYLSMGDFLWRSFVLHRLETFYAIRKDLESAARKIAPRYAGPSIKFEGFSRQAIPISKPAVINVSPPLVGQTHSARIEIEVALDVGSLSAGVAREWDALQNNEVVFLLAVVPIAEKKSATNGHVDTAPALAHGMKRVRCAEVIEVLDGDGRKLRDNSDDSSYNRQRKLLLRLDPVAYKQDALNAEANKQDLYADINLLVRRKANENNFKPVLESIKHLALSDVPAPAWLQEVFLGYSDPSAATYDRLSNKLTKLDYRDTFVDWQHLVDSMPDTKLVPDVAGGEVLSPPYVLESVEPSAPEERPAKKRRREPPTNGQVTGTSQVNVTSYVTSNTGPYLTDAPKLNTVRFTPTQVKAITSGTQPGLTVIVGPPGTGKTDVATQIVNNIYHDFPNQRTLLIAHSNQALNQLFQKIMALDIDERHLLRLGHGEGDLEGDADYSKHGRVESLLESANRHLYEVARLAASIDAPGAHGSSCETAEYFNQVYVEPAWNKFWSATKQTDAVIGSVIAAFPFHAYFRDAPQPLFPSDSTLEQIIDIVSGCQQHIRHIFDTLSDTRPFEILRSGRDKADYLLVKEARIIAMTSTHAAMRRQYIADLGFRYDNVIIEEAAQITEIDSFIPLALQKPRDGENKLQRVVLVGDHFQNSPIVSNLAFRQYANLEQSLFLRLVRLGVPTIVLDQQGRARPSLAELYAWRYPNLQNLPLTSSAPEFMTTNAGFKHDYQFINVDDYKGKGETEPTPHFIQNLGEAEYAVAIYQYMRLLGYPAEKISILTMYAGQRNLIKDVLDHRCMGKSRQMFGMPGKVMTVDKYQGEQNDCKSLIAR